MRGGIIDAAGAHATRPRPRGGGGAVIDGNALELATDVLVATAPQGVALLGEVVVDLRGRLTAALITRAGELWRALIGQRGGDEPWGRDDVRETLAHLTSTRPELADLARDIAMAAATQPRAAGGAVLHDAT